MRLVVAAVLLATGLASGALAQSVAPAPAPSGGPFTFTMPQSKVIVKVSDASLRPDASNRPNYFKLTRLAPLLILSGWLEPSARYKGLEAFWEAEKKSPVMQPPLAPTRIEMLREGRWEVVAFDVPLPGGGGAQSNLRAERVEAGTWIDLHISTASAKPSATMRAELLAALRKVEIVVKSQ